MFGPPVPPAPGARVDCVIDQRAIDQREAHPQRLDRSRAIFTSPKPISLVKVLTRRSIDDRHERFASSRLEAGGGSDSDDDKARRPFSPTPVARAASGHNPAEA
jgi:hypothetical protein